MATATARRIHGAHCWVADWGVDILWCVSSWMYSHGRARTALVVVLPKACSIYAWGRIKMGAADMLTPSQIAFAVTAPQALHRTDRQSLSTESNWFTPLQPFKNSSDSTTNVDCKFLTQCQKNFQRDNLLLCVLQGFYYGFGLSTVKRICLSRVKDSLKGVAKKTT